MATITGTLKNPVGTGNYSGPLNFQPTSDVKTIGTSLYSGQGSTLTISGGTLSTTLAAGEYVVTMDGTTPFTVLVPSGTGTYDLLSLITSTGAVTSATETYLRATRQILTDEEQRVVCGNIGVASMDLLSIAGLAPGIPSPRAVYCYGDSLTWGFHGYLETELQETRSNWYVHQRAIGGDTIQKVLERMIGCTYAGPVRGSDSLSSGDNLIKVFPITPALMDGAALGDYQNELARTGCVNPTRVHIYNRGEYACCAERRDLIARFAGSNSAILYEPFANAHELTNAANEDGAVSGLSVFNLGAPSQSDDVGSALDQGKYAAKFVLSGGNSVNHIAYITPTADSVYEVDAYVYLGTGTTRCTISTNSASSAVIYTDSSYNVTTAGAWQRIHAWVYCAADETLLGFGVPQTYGDTGAILYADNIRIRRIYAACTEHNLQDNDKFWLEKLTNALPTGLEQWRNYYVDRTDGTTIGLLLSSGGSADTYTGTGFGMLHAGWLGTYNFTPLGGTPDPDDALDYSFTLEPESADLSGVVVLWAGSNNTYADEAIVKRDTQRLVSKVQSGRFVILGILGNSTAKIGSKQRDWVTRHNAWLAATYPEHYLDVNQLLIDNHDPDAAQDVLDIGNGVHPASLRSDAIHLTAAGYQLVAEAVADKLRELGYF